MIARHGSGIPRSEFPCWFRSKFKFQPCLINFPSTQVIDALVDAQANMHLQVHSSPPSSTRTHPPTTPHTLHDETMNSDRRTDCVVPRLHPQTAGLYKPRGCWSVAYLLKSCSSDLPPLAHRLMACCHRTMALTNGQVIVLSSSHLWAISYYDDQLFTLFDWLAV